MGADQLKGKWMQFKGKLKHRWGKFSDDHLVQTEGVYDQSVGRAQERYGERNEELMKRVYQWHQ